MVQNKTLVNFFTLSMNAIGLIQSYILDKVGRNKSIYLIYKFTFAPFFVEKKSLLFIFYRKIPYFYRKNSLPLPMQLAGIFLSPSQEKVNIAVVCKIIMNGYFQLSQFNGNYERYLVIN